MKFVFFCLWTNTGKDLRNAVVLVFANKQDLKGALSSAELTQALGLHEIQNHEWHIQVFTNPPIHIQYILSLFVLLHVSLYDIMSSLLVQTRWVEALILDEMVLNQ